LEYHQPWKNSKRLLIAVQHWWPSKRTGNALY